MPYSANDDFKMQFARNLKTARENRGLSQTQLARMLGVSPKVISTYEVGRSMPNLEIARRMSNVLSIDLNVLVPMCA